MPTIGDKQWLKGRATILSTRRKNKKTNVMNRRRAVRERRLARIGSSRRKSKKTIVMSTRRAIAKPVPTVPAMKWLKDMVTMLSTTRKNKKTNVMNKRRAV
ncbi:hypothetical protein ACOSP7_024661 [Xanthoceras sorbifolium]